MKWLPLKKHRQPRLNALHTFNSLFLFQCVKIYVLWFLPSELPLTYKQCQRTQQGPCFWITPPQHLSQWLIMLLPTKPLCIIWAHLRTAQYWKDLGSDSGSVLFRSFNFLAILNTLSVQVNQKMDGVPDPPSGSTLLSHWACCYFPWKVRLFLLHQVSAFAFLSLHKTLCSVRGLAAPASQNNRDFVQLPYLALTPISGRLTDCSNHLFLAP